MPEEPFRSALAAADGVAQRGLVDAHAKPVLQGRHILRQQIVTDCYTQLLADVLGHGNEQCMLPGQIEAQAAARSDAAGGLLFSKAEVEALNEIAAEAGVAPFDISTLKTA